MEFTYGRFVGKIHTIFLLTLGSQAGSLRETRDEGALGFSRYQNLKVISGGIDLLLGKEK